MRLFRKSQPAVPVNPIFAFWEWWRREGGTIDPHRRSAAIEQLGWHVSAIHPDLTWHLGAGTASKHRLTVSAGGVAEVRPTAERWLRAAPPASTTWEFRASQEADPGPLDEVLEIAGRKLDLSKTAFRVKADEERFRVHVGVHHPSFPGLPENVRLQVTFLVLDWLLGEDNVVRWLGDIEALETAPEGISHSDSLLQTVARMAKRRDPNQWSLAQWQDTNGTPGLAFFRQSLRWIDYPTLDTHNNVRAAFAAQPNGLPADGTALEGLRGIEEELESLLGSRGILVGHETISGHRTFHAYTDGEDQNIAAALGEWALSRKLTIESAHDPAWRRVRHLTG